MKIHLNSGKIVRVWFGYDFIHGQREFANKLLRITNCYINEDDNGKAGRLLGHACTVQNVKDVDCKKTARKVALALALKIMTERLSDDDRKSLWEGYFKLTNDH